MGLLTPDPGLLFWMAITFGVVFFILAKYGFPVILKTVEDRKAYIDNSLKAAREGISIPLFPVGGVFSRGTAEEILAQGFPLVSMSRALICEPDFAAKLKSGAQDGSKCLACNGCYTIYRKRFVRCVQHQDEIEQFKTIPW